MTRPSVAVSLRQFKDDGTENAYDAPETAASAPGPASAPYREYPICNLTPGTRFCMRTPAVWGLPERRVYGEFLWANASRVRVLLSGGQHQVVFSEKDGQIRVFEAAGAAEVTWPREISVEPIDWEGYAAAQQTRDEDPGERSSVMTDTQATQATGIQARYDYHVKMLTKAKDAGDEAKVALLESKLKAIMEEAEQKEIKLQATGPVDSNGSSKKDKVQSISEGKVLPRPLTGAAKAAAEKKAAKLAAENPEAAAAMANLDKQKAKKDPAAQAQAVARKQRSSHNCLCGCGNETLSLFAPGHDARVKGIILKVERGQLKREDIPETVQPFVKFKGKWGTEDFTLTAAPVKIPGRPEVASTSLEALEAMDV